ncbi:hypothetical protein BH10BAC1_BH10BAC1_00970 [soil metagenome]
MKEQTTPRRGFINTIIGGVAAFGLSAALAPLKMQAGNIIPAGGVADAEKWFEQIKNKRKAVFDMPRHNQGRGIGWALTLMDTHNDLGVPDTDLSIVIVLRSAAAPLAIADPLWLKYGFGKRMELKDPETKVFTKRNLYAKCKTEDDDCLELFQKRGGLVCVCNHALEGAAEGLAKQLKLKKEDVQKEFMDNLLPEIQLMPSGIWAVNRAQELGCTFNYGG